MDLIVHIPPEIRHDGFDVVSESVSQQVKEQSHAAQCVAIPAVIYCLEISCPGFR